MTDLHVRKASSKSSTRDANVVTACFVHTSAPVFPRKFVHSRAACYYRVLLQRALRRSWSDARYQTIPLPRMLLQPDDKGP